MVWSSIAMRPYIVPAALAICSIYLGFRVVQLDGQIERLTRKLDAMAGAPAASEGSEAGAEGAGPAPTPKALEARLAAIEDDLAQVQEDYAGVDEQLAKVDLKNPGGTEEARILDVVGRAQSRIRERQIEFHEGNWRKVRSQLLGQFASAQKLEGWQSQGLQDLLDEETDSMIEIMVRPDAMENPEKTAADWQKRLEETDIEAMRLLDQKQREAWLGARFYERAVLWPWLPQLQQAQK